MEAHDVPGQESVVSGETISETYIELRLKIGRSAVRPRPWPPRNRRSDHLCAAVLSLQRTAFPSDDRPQVTVNTPSWPGVIARVIARSSAPPTPLVANSRHRGHPGLYEQRSVRSKASGGGGRRSRCCP